MPLPIRLHFETKLFFGVKKYQQKKYTIQGYRIRNCTYTQIIYKENRTENNYIYLKSKNEMAKTANRINAN